MILRSAARVPSLIGKPRASGDDPGDESYWPKEGR